MNSEADDGVINFDRMLDLFVRMCSVDSYFGDEERVAAIIRPVLEPLGIAFKQDAIGNIMGRWPGRGSARRPVMLNAHMDTVRPTPGMTPVVDDEAVRSDGSSVLGADDKAGVAAVVEALRAAHAAGIDHAPIDVVFTVGEDVGHKGSKAFDAAAIEARVGIVFDAGGPVGDVVTRAPGTRRFTARFVGKAAHAGIAPELGASAIAMMARAIDGMPIGRVDDESTANIGTIAGGEATNIIAPMAELRGEVRSLSESRLAELAGSMRAAMDAAAEAFGGRVDYDVYETYPAYSLDDNDPAVLLADRAIRAAGLAPRHVPSGGGSDAAEFISMGITCANLGMGYENVHSPDEFMPHTALRSIGEVAYQVIANS